MNGLYLISLCFQIMAVHGCGSSHAGNHMPIQEDCYPERSNVDTLYYTNGIIKQIADIYLITQDKGTKRYTPCNLPDSLKHADIEVIFSGIVKEIYPNERRVGSPFVISYIRKVER